MKAAVVLTLVGSLGLALGRSDCTEMCLRNMVDLAEDLGCSRGDMACVCSKVDFEYGIRDCTTEACPNDDVDAALEAGRRLCPGDFTSGVTSGEDGPTASESGSANPTETSDPTGTESDGSSTRSTGNPTITITSGTETIETTLSGTTLSTRVTNSDATRTDSDATETATRTTSGEESTATETETDSDSDSDDATATESASGSASPTDDPEDGASRAMVGTGLIGVIGLMAFFAA